MSAHGAGVVPVALGSKQAQSVQYWFQPKEIKFKVYKYFTFNKANQINKNLIEVIEFWDTLKTNM